MTIEIRSYEEADRATLVELWQRCELTRPWNDPNLDIDRKLALDDGLLLVATDAGKLLGSVMVGYDGHRGWVNYLAVDPDRQRTGLGAQLMQTAEDILQDMGCPKINLQIRQSNRKLVGFYAALGYDVDPVTSMGKRLIHDDTAK
ncbi:MAG: GNAT family acetyltransferase [Acidimicrobiales bacterium]